MTKKELLESDELKSLPNDAEIVFATDVHLHRCVPLNALNISVIKQCIDEPIESGVIFQPEYKTALVIDAIPYWYLKERYGIVPSDESKD